MTGVKAIAIWLSVSIFIFVVELVRREKLSFKYAMGWLLASSTAIVFAVFDRLPAFLSSFLGFELPSNFIFFSLLVMFIFLSLFLTIFLCRQESRNNVIAQKMAILENEVEQLKKTLLKEAKDKE
ncbi:MAG: DUF2304 domain-containing protein [Candidatus Omnitrophota bacterium]